MPLKQISNILTRWVINKGQNKFWMYKLFYILYTEETAGLMKLNNIILLTCFL